MERTIRPRAYAISATVCYLCTFLLTDTDQAFLSDPQVVVLHQSYGSRADLIPRALTDPQFPSALGLLGIRCPSVCQDGKA